MALGATVNLSSAFSSAGAFNRRCSEKSPGLVSFNSKRQRSRRGLCRGQVVMMPIGTPKVLYRTPGEGSWQFVDIWNVMYRERIIFLGQNIDDEFGNQILATMLYLDSLDSNKDLHFYMCCPGGDLSPTMCIYDTMKSLKSRIGTVVLGYCLNLAAFILAAGEKGMRSGMPLARIGMQAPQGAARGKADEVHNEAMELNRVRDYLFKELAIATGQPEEKIYKDFSRMKRFSAEEAVEYGIIDRILTPRKLQAESDRKISGLSLG